MIENLTVVSLIQAMLAPGIMISACALLLLGMNNKYSLVVNRIRLLDDEKRKLNVVRLESALKGYELIRMQSIIIQLDKLAYRVKLIRNAVLDYTIAVGFFIASCLSIGIQYIFSESSLFYFALALFLFGMLSVFIGVIVAAIETYRGYEIVKVELKEEY
jgi:Protein of unknown function (DUF2721)